MAQQNSIEIRSLSKMYKLYRKPVDKVIDSFGMERMLFWRKDYYREFWALQDINLKIEGGERLGIIGRNGAGKSTLLKIITGNLSSTTGQVIVNGKIQALMELGTGFHPEFTGRQNIRVSLAYNGFSQSAIDQKEQEIIEFAELGEFIDQPIKTYSAGMYARLAFSTSTSIEPDILIIDEILGAGDAYFYGKCIERMRGLTDKHGTTVLFVSHDLGSVQALCDRTVWIDRGKIREDGNTLQVIKSYSAMVRKETELRLRARDAKLGNKRMNGWLEDDQLYQSLLFRFLDSTYYQTKDCQIIYQIALSINEETIAEITPGGPQDNDSTQRHFIYDDPVTMNWGKPGKNNHGPYREHGAFGGSYGHAPFQFAIPKIYASNNSNCELAVTCEGRGKAYLEYFDGKEYLRLGDLSPQGYGIYRFNFPGSLLFGLTTKTSEEEEIEKEELDLVPTKNIASLLEVDQNSEYGTGEAKIINVRIKEPSGKPSQVLETNCPYQVEIEFQAEEPLFRPVFVFCIYLPDGRCASQWFAGYRDYGRELIEGRGILTFNLDHLLLGRGSYIASAAIFKELRRDGLEAESYHLLDRCLHFQVNQPIEEPHERGICLQPYQVALSQQ